MTATAAVLSRDEPRDERPWGIGGVPLLVLVAGVIVLVARPFVSGPSDLRIALFATSYVAIGWAAIAVTGGRAPSAAATEPRATSGPSASTAPTIPARVTLAVGLAAVAMAAVAAGTPVPSPWVGAVLPLSLLAAVAEEALFRRVAFAQLEWLGGPAIAVIGSAVLFALVHLPAYGTTALPVDLGAGLLFGWQRWASGTWTVPAATHAAANLVAVLR